MKNYDVALSATESAINSAGSAEAENARVLESVQGKIQELKKAFQDFALKTINSDFVKAILSAITNLIKFVDKIGGAKTILTAISLILANKFSTSLIKSVGSVVKLVTAIVSGNVVMTKFGKEAELSGNHAKNFGKHLNDSTVYINGQKLALAGLTVAITAVTTALTMAYQEYEKQQQAKIDLVSKTNDEVSKLDEESKSLQSLDAEMKNAYESASTLQEKKEVLSEYQKTLIDNYDKELEATNDIIFANDLLGKSYEETEQSIRKVEKALLDKQVAELNEGKAARDSLLDTATTNKLANKELLEEIQSYEDLWNLMLNISDESGLDLGKNLYGDLMAKGDAEDLVEFYKAMEEEIVSMDAKAQELWGQMKNQSTMTTKSMQEDYDKFSQSYDQKQEARLKNYIQQNFEEYQDYANLLEKKKALAEQYSKVDTNVEKAQIAKNIEDMQPEIDQAYQNLYQNANDKIKEYLDSSLPKVDTSKIFDFKGIDTNQLDNLEKTIKKAGGVTDETKQKVEDMWRAFASNENADYFEKRMKDLGVEITKSQKEITESSLESVSSLSDFANLLVDSLLNVSVEVENIEQPIEDLDGYLKTLNESIDNTQSAMKVLDQAIYEYNSSEGLTIDTLQSLLSLGSDYLGMLEYQNGTLQLSAEGHEQLKNSLLNEMEAAVADAAYQEILAIASGNVGSEASSSKGSVQAMGNALATAGNQASTAAGQFIEAARGLASLRGDDISGVSDAQISAVFSKYQGIMSNITSTVKSSTKGIGSGSYSGAAKKSGGGGGGKKSSGKSSGSSKDTWKEAFEARYKALQHELNMEQITEEQYTNELDSLYKQYFSDKTKYLDEYNKYEEEVYKKRKQIVKNSFNDELDLLEHKLNMNKISERDYTNELEKLYKKYFANRKDFLDEYTKYEEKVYKDRMSYLKEDYNSAISVATEVIDRQIESLQKQKDSLEKVNDETNRAIELEKLKNALYNAQNQKNMRVYYEGIGWVWEADKVAIEEAQKALDDFELEEATQKIDSQIDDLEELKNGWSTIASDYETQQDRINSAIQFGADFEQKVLNGRLEYLNTFVNSYNDLMDKLNPKTSAQTAMSAKLPIVSSYASGTSSAVGGLSLVGEEGAELRVLNSGDGIIPSDLTENLMDWGKINPSDLYGGNYIPTSSDKSNSVGDTVFNISNLALPGVSNANDFVKELKQFAVTHNKK